MKLRISNVFALIIAASSSLHADIYTWNGSTTGGATGVSNTWDTTTANWAGFGTAWPSVSTADDDAVFSGTAGSVAITTSVSANGITFSQTSTTSYTIGADNTAGVITLDGTAPTITSAGSASLNSVGAVLAGSAGLTKAGNRTLQLRGVNTYSGDTKVLNGNLLLGLGNNRLPVATKLVLGDGVSNTNGVFQMNSRSQQVGGIETAGTGTGNRVINSNATASTFTVANVTDQTFGGFLGGSTANDNNFNFTKSAAGRLVLTSSNTFTGTATISGGTLELGHAINTLADTVAVNVNGGTLDVADKTETIGALTVTSGSITGTTGVLSATSCAGKAGTVSAILAGTSNLSGTTTTWLTKDTAGTLELAAANTFTGNVTVTAGRLTLSNSAALGVADPTPGGTNRKGLISQGANRSVWLKGGISLPADVDIIASSNSGDGGGINNESGNNQIQGPVYFSTGNPALNISSAADALTISGNVTLTTTTRTLFLGGASTANNTISGHISENNAANVMPVIKQGAGKWIFSGTNTYKGDTDVRTGTLVLASGGSQKFYPKTDGTCNKFHDSNDAVAEPSPTAGNLTMDGAFDIDLTNANTASSWLLVDVASLAETFGPNFSVTDFTETPAASGVWKKTVGSDAYTFTEATGLLTRSAATNTYADWLAANPPAAGFATDSDNDGVSNAVENILGTNPNAYSAGLTQVSATSNSATFKHTLNPTPAGDLSYSYEWSTDLTEWKAGGQTNTAGTTATITPAGPVADVVTVTTTVTGGPGGKLFTRIKVTQP